MDLQLRDKTALVTGASAGIGRGIATTLAVEGVRLALLARRRPLLEELAHELLKLGAPQPALIVADLADASSYERIRDQVLRELGHCEILVNNAGGSQPAVIDEPEESWLRGMTINFTALRRLGALFLPSMRSRGYGRIINIGGTHEPIGINVTGSAKAAAQFWAKALSDEVAKDGITVNTVVPGGVRNQRMDQRYPTPAARQQYALEQKIPVGHTGEPEDIANLVAFLASPRARYLTGEVIYVDGGAHRYAY